VVLLKQLKQDPSDAIPMVKQSTRREIYERTLRARDYIDSNFRHAINLKDISQAALMSDNYLLKYFRQVMGVTPHQYIINKRLELAKALLTQTDMMIKDVVLSVGFEDASSFIRLFKFKFKQTPMQFRMNQKNAELIQKGIDTMLN
jgi:AraC family transcriptional regulator